MIFLNKLSKKETLFTNYIHLDYIRAVFFSLFLVIYLGGGVSGCTEDEDISNQSDQGKNNPEDTSDVRNQEPDDPDPRIFECTAFEFESFQDILESNTQNQEDRMTEDSMCPPYTEYFPSSGNMHIAEGPIYYEEDLPSSGPHRPQWAKWGEYTYLPPQRWLHNLEHGGITFLYHPCADQRIIDELKELINDIPEDDDGAFRWILTPSARLRTPLAILAWEWKYEAECVDQEIARDFVQRQYRQAPEDIARDGAYSEEWVGR